MFSHFQLFALLVLSDWNCLSFHSPGELLFILQNVISTYPHWCTPLLCHRLLFITSFATYFIHLSPSFILSSLQTCRLSLCAPLELPAQPGVGASTSVFQVQPSEVAHRVAQGAGHGCHSDPHGDLCMPAGPTVTARLTSITGTSANTAASRSASKWA